MISAIRNAESSWMAEGAAYQDVILSNRIRLARNLKDYPFPARATPEEKQALGEEIGSHLPWLLEESGREWLQLRLEEVTPQERGVLVDKHLISPQLAGHPEGASLLLSTDEVVSIMINEEDHIRLQVLLPGQQLHEAWVVADHIDNLLENRLDYAFRHDLGYLTACPTNVGTGLRASVMAHLPALVISKKYGRILTAINQMGFVVRGIYGEGSEATGQIFQISNQISLGHTEVEVIQSLQGIVKQVVEEERNTRIALQNSSEPMLIDRIGRSLGTLTHARLITTEDAVQLLSDLRLGINLQRIRGVGNATVSALLVKIQPAWLSLDNPSEGSSLDWQRAGILRQALEGVSLE
ncbi:MAG: protein arginine kinase [Symbiobacteriaceae bacterium]|nr:protein arginine kinase [Symbiobacteriaceae bacterium]